MSSKLYMMNFSGVMECWSIGVMEKGTPNTPVLHCSITPICSFTLFPASGLGQIYCAGPERP